MRRRAFLASALTAASTVTAGCGSVGPRTEHTDPTVLSDDNPRDDAKYLEFSGDDTELATVGVDPRLDPVPRHLHVSVSHSDDTELRSLTQRFVAPAADGTAPRLSLRGPFEGGHEPHPTVSLFRDGRAAVVEVHRFGDLADETAFIGLPVTRWPESAGRLVVESTVELVEAGIVEHTHVLDGRLSFEFDAGAGAGNRSADAPESSGRPVE